MNPLVSVQCPPGYYCEDGYHAVPCEKGFYSSEEGAFKCTPCDGTSYARAGASECTACEDNTARKVQKLGNKLSEHNNWRLTLHRFVLCFFTCVCVCVCVFLLFVINRLDL